MIIVSESPFSKPNANDFLDPIPNCSGSMALEVRRRSESELVPQPRLGDEHVLKDVRVVSNPGDGEWWKIWCAFWGGAFGGARRCALKRRVLVQGEKFWHDLHWVSS